jgi:hypothetical protein
MASPWVEEVKRYLFRHKGDKMAYFNLKIADHPGLMKVEVTAKSGSQSTSQKFELDVRIPNPPLTQVVSATLAPGQNGQEKFHSPA